MNFILPLLLFIFVVLYFIHICSSIAQNNNLYSKYKIFTVFSLYTLFIKYEHTTSVPKKMEFDDYFIKWIDKENEKYEKFYQCYNRNLFIFKLGLYTNNNYWKNDYSIISIFTPLGYLVYIINFFSIRNISFVE